VNEVGERDDKPLLQHQSTKPLPRKTSLFEFSDTEAIKEKVRAAKFDKSKPPYDVKDNYHETGVFQAIAKHEIFENTTLGVIVINALWISVDTDGNTANTMLTAELPYVVMDTLFFVYFSIEVITRFLAFKRKLDCLKDGWFKFDSVLVILYAFDPFTIALMAHIQGGDGLNLPTSVLRLCRLARLSRLVRMLRSLPELMIMIKGMVTSTTSVGYTMGLLMIITYVFAIAIRNLVVPALDGGTDGEEAPLCAEAFPNGGLDNCIENVFFSSVPEAMHNLMIFGTFGDELSSFMWGVKEQSPIILALSWTYISLASLTVMNMLVGVLCEVTAAVAEEENESMLVERVNEGLGSILEQLDDDHDGTLSWNEFQAMLEFPKAIQCLDSMSVDIASMVDMAEDSFFEDGVPVSMNFADFMSMVLDLRGGQPATVQDILRSNKRFTQKIMSVTTKMQMFNKKLGATGERLDRMVGKVDKILGYLNVGKVDQDVSVTSPP